MNVMRPLILVVDDDTDTRANMADIFMDCGYEVETAPSGALALEKAQQHTYAVGLLDMRMPGMDGLTLCRHLKQLQPHMVALIVTAYARTGLDAEAAGAGVWRIFPKPIDFPKLLALVEKARSLPN